jgi:MFS family permease
MALETHPHVHESDTEAGNSARATSALTLIAIAHGINHAQSAVKPLVFPLVLRELNFGYSELGIMLGVASAVGGLLQLGAGALGRVIPRHLILGLGNASVGLCFVLVGLAQSYLQFFFWTVMSRVGGAAQHPVGSALLSYHFKKKKLGVALATHFTAGNVGTAFIPLCAAVLIGLWGWRVVTILFALPAVLVGIAMCIWLKEPARVHATEISTGSTSFWRDSGQAIRDRKLRWILIAAMVAAGGSGHGIVSSFLPLYLSHNLGMDAPTVGFIFTLMMLGSIAGPLLGGKLADGFHPKMILICAYLISAAAIVSLPWFGANLFAVSVTTLLLGLTAFATHPILQTMVAQVTGDSLRDTGFAWFYTATFLAGAFWSPAVGYLSEWWGLTAAFAAMAASFMAASLCVLCGRFDRVSAGAAAPARATI